MERQRDASPADGLLRQRLLSSVNPTGGWGYYPAKSSRLEPTCWALLALAGGPASDLGSHRDFLLRCQQASGWLVEEPALPVNIGFNALAAFTFLAIPSLTTDDVRRRVLDALVASKGVRTRQNDQTRQDNSLQGWSWVDATFSWVEPTSWALLALKKARRVGLTDAVTAARIEEAERLLIDRTCRTGGWNFGNATMMQQDLRAYVPTSALGLLAMQDRRDHPVVVRGLEFLEGHWGEEPSATALGLSLICLSAYDRPTREVEARLHEHIPAALSFGNLHGISLALAALSHDKRGDAFRL